MTRRRGPRKPTVLETLFGKRKRALPVRTVNGYFEDIPPASGSELWLRDWHEQWADAIQTTIMGEYVVPDGKILDVTHLVFRIELAAGIGNVLAPDLYTGFNIQFQPKLGSTSPWNQESAQAFGGQPFEGFWTLNREVLSEFGSVPGHIVVASGQTFRVQAVQTGVVGAPAGNNNLICEARGRLVPTNKWDEAMATNGFGGV